jgi:hypothetical protein
MKTPLWLLKLSNWIAWISSGMGVFSIICAGLSSILPRYTHSPSLDIEPELMFGVDHRVNFFQIATCFFVLTIGIVLFQIKNQLRKE